VLTRLPPPHRAPAALVATFLGDRFSARPLGLTAERQQALIDEFARLGVVGGASYDGLVAAVALEHDAELVTLDRRATITYDRLGASYRLLT
jgi:predicted nucleic acid-binding protein